MRGTDASVASFGYVPKPDANSNPLYAVGKSIHGNVSWLASLGPSPISKEASWVGEIAWNMLESVDKNPMTTSDNVHSIRLWIQTHASMLSASAPLMRPPGGK